MLVDEVAEVCKRGRGEDGRILEVLNKLARSTRRGLGLHTVMRSVFDGGEGWMRGGRSERSRVSGVLRPFDEELDDRDRGGVWMCCCEAMVSRERQSEVLAGRRLTSGRL